MTSTTNEPHTEAPRVAAAPPGYSLSTDATRIAFDFVPAFLRRESYWAKSITKRRLRLAIQHSLCFSVFFEQRQVAFARVITDYAVFAYLCDVFVDPSQRGRGVGKWLMQSI